MGEGWSDFFALVLTTSPSDTATTARGVGSYVSFQPADGAGHPPDAVLDGHERQPVDVRLDQGHGQHLPAARRRLRLEHDAVGGLLEPRRRSTATTPNVYADWYTGGNNLAIQLVMDGLKFQPCGPASSTAATRSSPPTRRLTGGANQCEIWRGFAKRGLGTGAVQGLSTSRTDNSQDFTVPATCSATAGSFRPPIQAAPTLNERDAGDTVPVKYSITGLAAGAGRDAGVGAGRTATASGRPQQPTPIQTNGTGARRRGTSTTSTGRRTRAWAGTCRRLTLQIEGASSAVAYFRFG